MTMIRKSIALATLLLASVASAQHNRAMTPPSMNPGNDMMMIGPSAATVSGTVSSVSGHTISLANGLVTIDATNAKIYGDHGAQATVSQIVPGSIVLAVVSTNTVAANAPLPASTIAILTPAQITLTGTVSAIDVAHQTLTVLGRTIAVNSSTRFTAPLHGQTATLADVQPNELVSVEANASGATLLATNVLIVAPIQQQSMIIHGSVKSIAAESWVITTRDKDVTVAVNAQTKFVGDPKVGDTVDAAVRVDASNAYVAIAIMKSIF